ncbi:dUTP diphosphatase [Weissella diestrammenae]|uniref:dUTP diphosphatase n=1 Tax=Weissella diestrammenae TaxID=1162633 RepID=A0A7G9T3T0_9LACO|nr:dUTP diphosphatase [Weissella diestrammenae]MCM0582739.1 dUTP diphosphatase [Weissella diestrammenae]QNN74755.1 dUTP diphosphatase [Weissella diestrammenae]
MTRRFAIVTKYQDAGLHLPKRATKQAAGYDFEAAEDFILPTIWKLNFIKLLFGLFKGETMTETDYLTADQALKPLLVPTGIKAYMNHDEYLMLANRSSGPLKRRLILPNGVGVIDADYADNESNEGEIFIQLLNFGVKDVQIKKGERIGQGIFMPFLVTDDDAQDSKQDRVSGFGSTGDKK